MGPHSPLRYSSFQLSEEDIAKNVSECKGMYYHNLCQNAAEKVRTRTYAMYIQLCIHTYAMYIICQYSQPIKAYSLLHYHGFTCTHTTPTLHVSLIPTLTPTNPPPTHTLPHTIDERQRGPVRPRGRREGEEHPAIQRRGE